MYVLAIRPNLLQVRDAESGKLIEGAQLDLHYAPDSSSKYEENNLIRSAVSPCELNAIISQDSDVLLRLVRVSCSDPQYFPISIANNPSSSLFARSTIYLQRKVQNCKEAKPKREQKVTNPKALSMAI